MSRKTIEVEALVREGNRLLALGANDADSRLPADFRRGVMAMMEHVLFASDRYAGFLYQQLDDDAQTEDDTLRRYLIKKG